MFHSVGSGRDAGSDARSRLPGGNGVGNSALAIQLVAVSVQIGGGGTLVEPAFSGCLLGIARHRGQVIDRQLATAEKKRKLIVCDAA